jgi:hypothetical protein
MTPNLPLPAQHRPRLALRQREDRGGVRGSGTLKRGSFRLPLTLTLSPQAARGDSRGVCGKLRVFTIALLLMLGSTPAVYAAELTFDLKIQGGRLPQNMRLVRVKQGDAVTLRWTSDRLIVLHLHGYDIERRVEPGIVSEMAFVARATGRFSVEEHKPDAKGGHSHGEAALARIEVLPR